MTRASWLPVLLMCLAGCITPTPYLPPPPITPHQPADLVATTWFGNSTPPMLWASGTLHCKVVDEGRVRHVSGDATLVMLNGSTRLVARHPVAGRFLDIGIHESTCWLWLKGDGDNTLWYGPPDTPGWSQWPSLPLEPGRLAFIFTPGQEKKSINSGKKLPTPLQTGNIVTWPDPGGPYPRQTMRWTSHGYPDELVLYHKGEPRLIVHYDQWITTDIEGAFPSRVRLWSVDSGSMFDLELTLLHPSRRGHPSAGSFIRPQRASSIIEVK